MKTRRRYTAGIWALLIALVMGVTALGHGAKAGPEVVGNPDGANLRALVSDGESVKRIVYVATGAHTMANTTPVATDPKCGMFGDLHKAEVRLTGTMTGTAPTLAIKWQNSMDGGTTWTDVGTWTTINATVTPASQSQTVADITNNSTAVAYGDCWRVTYTFGGTGTVTANFGVTGLEK
jgi:hypothetical protein